MFLNKLFKKKNDVSEVQYRFAANPVMVDPSKMQWVIKPIMESYIKEQLERLLKHISTGSKTSK